MTHRRRRSRPPAAGALSVAPELRHMERFVRFVVAGGVVLVAGLWLAELTAARSIPRLLGVAVAALGAVGVLYGIVLEIEWS